MGLMIVTLICVTGAIVGVYFVEGNNLRMTLHLLGMVVWINLTFNWWFLKLLDKFVK